MGKQGRDVASKTGDVFADTTQKILCCFIVHDVSTVIVKVFMGSVDAALRSSTAKCAGDGRDDKKNEEYEEEYFCDSSCCACYTAESEDGSNESKNEKCDGPA